MKKLRLGFLLALMTLSGPALSENCADLARAIGRESSKFGDSNKISILNTANLCIERYERASSDQKAQIEAAYGVFSGGWSGSLQQIHDLQESRCQNQWGSSWYNRIHSEEIDRVSQVGADVVRACINQQSFRLATLTIQDEALTASFRYSGAGETKINGLIINPPKIAVCSVFHDGKVVKVASELPGTVLKSGDTITLDCTRIPQSPSDALVNKSEHLSAEFNGGVIGIATAADVAEIPVISYSIPNIPKKTIEELDERIAQIETELRTNKSSDAAHQIVIAGYWDGGRYYQSTPGPMLIVKQVGEDVRIYFDPHQFYSPPIVVATPKRMDYSINITDVNYSYADIAARNHGDGGTINGYYVNNRPFYFTIVGQLARDSK